MSKKAKTTRVSPYKPMPRSVATRSGCKVAWEYYDNEETAKEASVAATYNGNVLRGFGYDFGFCSPGSIRKVPDDAAKNAGLWEVCVG